MNFYGLTRFEQQDCDLSQVEIDEVFCFVRDVTTEVAAHDAVPCGVIFLIEFLLDVSCDVLQM